MAFLNKITPIKLGLVLGVLFLILGVVTISDYGINWDEPFHFHRGQAYLSFFQNKGNPKFVIKKNEKRTSFIDLNQQPGYYLKNDCCHPVLNGELFSLSNKIFYEKLGWLKDVEAYSLAGIFLSSLLVGLISWFASKELGRLIGIASGLSLFFYPLFLGETHFNVKDPPETVFYSLFLIFVFYAVNKLSWKFLFLGSILFGLALGTKFNILFSPLIIVPWLIFAFLKNRGKLKNTSSKFFLILILPISFLVGFSILFSVWPYLWRDPINNLVSVFAWYKHIGTETNYEPQFLYNGFNLYPIVWILFTTPLSILILFIVGIFSSIRNILKGKKNTEILLLVTLWFIVPILRVIVPGSTIYGGDRQIMEFVPAMAVLSGIGFHTILGIRNKIYGQLLISLAVVIFVFNITEIIKIHPNETVYFNQLAGGLKGGYDRNITEAGGDLGNVYKQGVNWLNKNAEENARLTLINNGTSAIPGEFIRKDIGFSDDYWSGQRKRGEYIMNTSEVGWDSVFPDKSSYVKSLKPVYEVVVQGAPILIIWKND